MGGPGGEVAFGRFVPSWRSEARLFINRAPSWQPSWRGQAIRSTFGNIFLLFARYRVIAFLNPAVLLRLDGLAAMVSKRYSQKWNEVPGAWRGVPAQGTLCMSSGYAPVCFAGDCAG
ncbi:Uncharacterised protein [uncultured Collinsella sp.]|nr:Uncharacterised protein [uncultured Collinsella sp.]